VRTAAVTAPPWLFCFAAGGSSSYFRRVRETWNEEGSLQCAVLFEVLDEGYAVVYLSGSNAQQAPPWPATLLFSSLADWVERGMKRDHQEWSHE
jgi:hypothetical protein